MNSEAHHTSVLTPVLFKERTRPMQILLGGVIPAAIGALAGVMIGVSTGAYWAIAVLAAIGSIVSGFEHLDGWGAADRGLAAGTIYGAALLIAHARRHPRKSVTRQLPTFPDRHHRDRRHAVVRYRRTHSASAKRTQHTHCRGRHRWVRAPMACVYRGVGEPDS
jgi:hypothetical protein